MKQLVQSGPVCLAARDENLNAKSEEEMRGKQWLQVLMTAQLFFAVPIFAAQSQPPATKVIHLNGEKARTLTSILVSGGVASPEQKALQEAQPMPPRVVIVLHDLDVSLVSTHKYDADMWIYKLDVYSAKARIGSSENPVAIGEGTVLWSFLINLGLKPDLSLGSADLEVSEVDCRINAEKPFFAPARFQCDLTVPGWALAGGP